MCCGWLVECPSLRWIPGTRGGAHHLKKDCMVLLSPARMPASLGMWMTLGTEFVSAHALPDSHNHATFPGALWDAQGQRFTGPTH